MFRHRGERKVKTIEEDMEEVTSSAADLLEDGEELIGRGPGDLSQWLMRWTVIGPLWYKM